MLVPKVIRIRELRVIKINQGLPVIRFGGAWQAVNTCNMATIHIPYPSAKQEIDFPK